MSKTHDPEMKTQPWIDNPHRLISWLTMNKFSAAGFYKLGQTLEALQKTLDEAQVGHADAVLSEEEEASLEAHFFNALELAPQIGLMITFPLIYEARDAAKAGVRLAEISRYLWAIGKSLEREMAGRLFLYVPGERSAYYEKEAEDFLGRLCCARFPSAVPEVDEAMKCYAVGRYTACAFHLMRATETGIKALGIAIGADMRNGWGNVFGEHEKQLATKPAVRPPHWSSHGDFLENIAADLRSVKPHRNAIMHLEQSYNEERAEKLLVMIPEFLRKLSERMNENGKLL